MKPTFKLLASAFAGLVLSSSSHAFEFVVSNNGNEAVFDPFNSAQTGAQYYNFFSASGHPSFGTQEDTAFFWMHENSNTGELSLSMIFDAPTSGDNTLVGDLDMSITGLTAGSYVSLSDDGVELQMSSATSATGNWRWLECCTDGGVISGIASNSAWEIDLDISNHMGISEFYFLAGDHNSPTTVMAMTAGDTITVSMREGSAIPLPMPVMLMGLGFLLIGWRAHRAH